jgi:hypothetical protein
VAIAPVVPSPTNIPVSQVSFTFSEPVTGVSLAAISLTDNGGASLLTSAQTLTTIDNQTFVLGNLSVLTGGNGVYTLAVSAGAGINDLAGNLLQTGASANFVVSNTMPRVAITPVVPSPTNTPVSQISITFSEQVTGVSLASLSLTSNGGANLLTSVQTLTTTNNQKFVLGNLSGLTSGNGVYTFAVSAAAGISDLKGNPLQSGAIASFVIDTVPPTVAIAPIVPSPTRVPVSQVTLTFSEPVTGVSLAALSLTNNGGANLLTSAQTLATTDNQTFVLGNLTGLTSGNGVYTLAVSAAAGIQDLAGNPLKYGASTSFVVNATTPTATITPLVPNISSTAVNQLFITFNEAVSGFTLSSLTLTENGGANLLTSAQTLTSTDQTHWTLGNLAPLTTADGTYTLTVNPSTAITDTVGNPLAVGATTSFTVVTPTPIPTTVSLSPVADAYVRDGAYAGENFSTSTLLMAKDAVSGGGYVRNTYLTFNLKGVAPITSAILQIYGDETAGSPEPSITIAAYPVGNTTWAQNTITFDNAPAVGSPAINTVAITGATSKTYSLNLTSYLQQQQALGNTLVSVALKGVQVTDGGTQFNSTLAATNRPALVITGLTPTPTPIPTPTPVALSATADSYVQDGTYAKVNYGTASQLLVKDAIAGDGYVRTAYLQFNLAGLAPITSAALQLYGNELPGASIEPSVNIVAYAVASSAWTQNSITDVNAPAFGGAPLATVVVSGTTASLYSYNLTAYLQQQQAVGNTTVSIALTGTMDTNAIVAFNSTNAASNMPALSINQ